MSLLTVQEQATFDELESIVEDGLDTFYKVGSALIEIQRHPKWWKPKYGTWTNYLNERWGMSQNYARRLTKSAEMLENSLINMPTGTPKINNEYQLRPILTLPQEKHAEAWQRAVESVPEGEPITHKHTQAIVEQMKEESSPTVEVIEPEMTIMDEFEEWFKPAARQLSVLAYDMTTEERGKVAHVLRMLADNIEGLDDAESIS